METYWALILIPLLALVEAQTDEGCDVVCSALYDPVCGYSETYGWKNFTSSCWLQAENKCYNTDYYVLQEGLCLEGKPDAECDIKCANVYNPVWGYDPQQGLKQFTSPCYLQAENSCHGTSYTIA